MTAIFSKNQMTPGTQVNGTTANAGATLDAAPFVSPIGNFYMTDPISRASETMAKCTREFAQTSVPRTGTDG